MIERLKGKDNSDSTLMTEPNRKPMIKRNKLY